MTDVVDLCFMMDCTGSMSSYISACKNDIRDTVDKIVAAHPDAVINVGFVAYRDHCDGAKRIEKFLLTPNVGAFQQFVGGLAATGGGDYPEDVLGGLWESATMNWSAPTRVLFHIFDAPPHGRPKYHDNGSENFPDGHPSDKPLREILTKLRDSCVDYYMMKLTNSLEKMVAVFKAEANTVDYENVEERIGVSDVSKVMDDVAVAVLSSMAVRVSTKSRHGRRVDPVLHPMARASEFRVYCGIDFGTHGSAFATCTAGDPTPRAGTNWGGSGIDVKTLTNVLLGPNKKLLEGCQGFGDAALEKFLDMEPEEQREHYFFRRFKMALYQSAIEKETDEREEKVDIQGRIKAANGKFLRSDAVLVEALKFMVRQVMEHVETSYGVTNPADVQWIVTVPAIWSQKSRKVMERVGRRAGIPTGKHDQLMVALEPECAAVVAQDTLGLSGGDCYMMIDCGGGTVDIACHEMINGTEVREIYKATGGPWGATYIDDAFIRFLGEAFGEDVVAEIDQYKETEMPGVIEAIIASFNVAKTRLVSLGQKKNVDLGVLKPVLNKVIGDGKAINERLSHLPNGTAQWKDSRGMLSVSGEIWEKLFNVVLDPLVDHIQGLLANPDLDRRIRILCVVGGFSESPILMDRFSKEFGARKRVVRPPNPRLTVVKGAAKYGLMPTVIAARSAPKTIGIAIRDTWNSDTDPESRRKFVRGEGYVVDNVFFPFIRAGQAIPRDMPPIVHYFEPVNLEHFQIEIYQSDEANPRFVPSHPCGVIGPIEFPENFDHNLYDICVQIDFSGRMVSVRVQFGEEDGIPVDIDWE